MSRLNTPLKPWQGGRTYNDDLTVKSQGDKKPWQLGTRYNDDLTVRDTGQTPPSQEVSTEAPVQSTSTSQQVEGTIDFAGEKTPKQDIVDVAALQDTTPETIARLGTWQGRFEARLASTAVGQTLLRAEQGLGDIAATGLSLASRAGIIPDSISANIQAEQARRQQYLEFIERNGDITAVLGERGSRIYNNVVRSGAKVAATGLAGGTVVLSNIAAENFDQGIETAKGLGLDGTGQIDFGLRSATIETGITFLFGRMAGKLGFKNFETMMSPGVRKVAAETTKKFVRGEASALAGGAAIETAEEGLVALVGLLDKNSETGKRLDKNDWGAILEAGIAGAAGVGAVGAIQSTARALDRGTSDRMIEQAVRGAKSAEQWAIDNPDKAEKAGGKLTNREFQALTGLKKTSKTFRDAFRDTIGVFKEMANQDVAPASQGADATQESVPVVETTPDTPPAEGAQAASESFTGGTPLSEGQSEVVRGQKKVEDTGQPAPSIAPIEVEPTPSRSLLDKTLDAVPLSPADAKLWLKRNFTTAGLNNEAIDRANDTRLGRIAGEMKTLGQLRADFTRSVREHVAPTTALGIKDLDKVTPADTRKMNAQLKGEDTDLPIEVKSTIAAMRAHIDSLSRQMVEAGFLEEDVEAVVTENLETYLTRAFRKFKDKNWTETVKQDKELMSEVKSWLGDQHPEDDQAKLEWRLNVMLDRDSARAKADAGDVGNTDADFLSILKERKDLPEVVRRLYGEFNDPWINYTNGIAKMSSLLATKEFTASVKEAGAASGFLTTEEDARPANYRPIDGSKLSQLKDLHGLYASPETAQALNDLFAPELHGKIYRGMVAMSGYTKWAQTVGNSKTHARNFITNITLAMSNGDLRPGFLGHAASTTWADISKRGDVATRAYIKRLAQLGLVGQDVRASEIGEMTKAMADIDRDVSNRGIGVWGKINNGMDAASQVYQGQDNFWKINGFENKKLYYAKVNPDATQDKIEEMAAADVLKHYPSFSKVTRGVRAISKFPTHGSFVSFHAEIIRNLKNSAVTITNELRDENPDVREMGKQRLVGLVSSVTLAPAVSAVSAAIQGVTPAEEEDLRKFQPNWSENSLSLYLGKDEALRDLIDLSFMDARAILIKPLVAGLRDGAAAEKFERAAIEIVSPLNEDIFFSKVFSWIRNSNPDGTKVHDKETTLPRQIMQDTAHFGGALVPGTFKQVDRIRKGAADIVSPIGKPYNTFLETAAAFGLRISSVDVAVSLGFRNSDLNRRAREVEGNMNKPLFDHNVVSPGRVTNDYEVFNAKRKAIFQEQHEIAMAAIRLGVPVADVFLSLKAATSKARADQIFANEYVPYLPSENALDVIATRRDGVARVQHILKLFEESLRKEEELRSQ